MPGSSGCMGVSRIVCHSSGAMDWGVDVKDDPCVGPCFRESSCDTVYDNANADANVRNPALAYLDLQDTTEGPRHQPQRVSPVRSDRSM